MKRVLALVLCLCMVLTVAPAVAAAETGPVSVYYGDTETYYETLEAALATAEGGTIILHEDVTAGQVVIPKDFILSLNGYTLTADMVIVFNGMISDNMKSSSKLAVPQDMLKIIGNNGGTLMPVWDNVNNCYIFAAAQYQQIMNVAEDLSYANYIFIPNFSGDALALLGDGSADNGISVKVLLSWNNGASQQIYTFSDELVAQVYGSADENGVCAKVFQLTITGFAGIEDMTACAVVESAAGGKIANAESKVALPEPEPEEPPVVEPEVVEKELVLTVDSLGLPSGSYTSSTATVGGVDFEWIQLGNYSNGIQVRDKNGNTSTLWNTSAFGAGIKEIRLAYSSTKDITNSNADAEIFYFGNEAGTYIYETKLSTTANVKEYVITPDAGDYTFVKFEHDLNYTMYWDSVTIVYYGEADGTEPEEPTTPSEPEPEEPTTPSEPEPTEPTEPTEPENNDPAADSVLTITEANALGTSKEHNSYTEGKYYVTGVVAGFSDTQYGNMYIADEAGNSLLVYGTYSADGQTRYDAMEVKPAVGDTVTVYGIIGQYSGAAQMKNGWVTEHIPGEGEPENNDPAADSTLTIAEAIALGASKIHNVYTEGKYYVSGVITEVYGTEYGNMRITDDAGNILTVYGTYSADGKIRYDAMEVQPVAGDTITVYGIIGQYKDTPQMKNGWLIEHIPAEGGTTEPEPEEPTEPTVPSEPVEPEEPADPDPAETTVSKTVADLITEYGWTDKTTKQSFTLDDVVSVEINGGSNTGKAYGGDHIRIYATDTPAGTITISVPEGYELVSITITTQTGTYAFLCLDGTTEDISNTTVAVSGTSVVLNSVKNGSNGKQVRVTAIEVTYK